MKTVIFVLALSKSVFSQDDYNPYSDEKEDFVYGDDDDGSGNTTFTAITCTPYCVEDFANCLPPRGTKNDAIFLPYGTDEGDTQGPVCDDCAVGPFIQAGIPYFNRTYTDLYASSNGVISFDAGVVAYTAQAFPLPGKVMLTALWTDLDFELSSDDPTENVWFYRQMTATDLDIVNDMIRPTSYEFADVFVGVEGFVVTWYRSFFYAQVSRDRYNTFQAIVVHDGPGNSYAIFNFGDIEWATGRASGGDACSGLGGFPGSSGFNDGEGNFFATGASQSDGIIGIDDATNVGVTGRYIYKIDAAEIEEIVEVKISTATGGVSDAINHLCDEGTLNDHGCACSSLFLLGSPGLSGDSVDNICHDWRRDRNCLRKDGGQCFGTIGAEYTVNPTTRACSDPDGSCEHATCIMDVMYTNMITAEILSGTYVFSDVNEDSCVHLDAPFGKPMCCGESPLVQAYNPLRHDCIANNLVEI